MQPSRDAHVRTEPSARLPQDLFRAKHQPLEGMIAALKLMSSAHQKESGMTWQTASLHNQVMVVVRDPVGEPTPPTMRCLLSGNQAARARASPT